MHFPVFPALTQITNTVKVFILVIYLFPFQPKPGRENSSLPKKKKTVNLFFLILKKKVQALLFINYLFFILWLSPNTLIMIEPMIVTHCTCTQAAMSPAPREFSILGKGSG